MGHWLLISEKSTRDDRPAVNDRDRKGALLRNLQIQQRTTLGRIYTFFSEDPIPAGELFLLEGRLNKTALTFPEQFSDPEQIESHLRSMEGDYAYCHYSDKHRRIHIGRDQLGYKALFEARCGDLLAYSTSLQLLLETVDIPLDLNENAVADFLLINMVSRLDLEATPFKYVRMVPPATMIRLDSDGLTELRTWSLESETIQPKRKALEEASEEFRQILAACVAERCVSQNVGLALSGGIDSTLVGALAGKAGVSVKAFTMSFQGVHEDEEWKFASMVARQYGWEHERIECEKIKVYEPETWDLNLQRSSVSSTAAVMARRMSQNRHYCLNGLSADNLFASEPPRWNGAPSLIHNLRDLSGVTIRERKRPILGLRSKIVSPPFPAFKWMQPEFMQRLQLQERWDQAFNRRLANRHPTHPKLAESLAYIDWTERFRGMLSYQVFDPFYDLRMVRFALSMEPFPNLYGKTLQRTAAKGLLPELVRTRRKTMFGDVIGSMLRAAPSNEVDEWASHSELERFVDRSKLPKISDPCADSKELFNRFKPLVLNEWLVGLDRFKANRKPVVTRSS